MHESWLLREANEWGMNTVSDDCLLRMSNEQGKEINLATLQNISFSLHFLQRLKLSALISQAKLARIVIMPWKKKSNVYTSDSTLLVESDVNLAAE